MNIYVIGSLAGHRVREVADELREQGHVVFDDWHGVGPDADKHWQQYETERGKLYIEALHSPLATHAYEFDKHWLDWADVGVLVLPAGKSGHLELGYLRGRGKRAYILLDGEPERWDLMYRLATGVCRDTAHLIYRIDWAQDFLP